MFQKLILLKCKTYRNQCKAEEPEIKLPTFIRSWRKQENSRKYLLFHWLCKSFWLYWSQQTVENSSRDENTRPILPVSWETCMQVKKQQLEPYWNNWLVQFGKRVRQGCILSPCLPNVYLECCAVLSRFSHVHLFVALWTVAHQVPLPMWILQARILQWVAMPPSGDFPDPGIKPVSPALAGEFFTTSTTWEASSFSVSSLVPWASICISSGHRLHLISPQNDYIICGVHHAKCQAGWVTSWNQNCWEKPQQPQICRWCHFNGRNKRK